MRLFDKAECLTQLGRTLGHFLLQAGVEGFQLVVLGLGQGRQAQVFSFESLAFQCFADDGDDFAVIPGLSDVTINLALVDGGDGRCDIRIAGQQQPHGLRPAPFGLLEKGGAIHFRHAHVGNNQIDVFSFKYFQSFGAAIPP